MSGGDDYERVMDYRYVFSLSHSLLPFFEEQTTHRFCG